MELSEAEKDYIARLPQATVIEPVVKLIKEVIKNYEQSIKPMKSTKGAMAAACRAVAFGIDNEQLSEFIPGEMYIKTEPAEYARQLLRVAKQRNVWTIHDLAKLLEKTPAFINKYITQDQLNYLRTHEA